MISSCLLLTAHALWHRGLFLGNCPDDAYISFRYAENLATGHGLVFNPGERAEGYSNLSWVLLLSVIAGHVADLTLPAQLLGLLCAMISIPVAVVTLRVLFRIESWVASAATGLFISASGYYAAWTVGGLETSLHALLLLLVYWRTCVEIHHRARTPWSGLLLALLVATRPEGLAFAAAMLVLRVATACKARNFPSRSDLIFLGLLLLPTLALEAWRIHYYGWHLFGTAVRAKTGFGLPILARGTEFIGAKVLVPYGPLVFAPLLLIRTQLPALIAAMIIALHLLVLIAAGGDWGHGRLVAPLVPILAVLFGAVIGRGMASRPQVRRWLTPTLIVGYSFACFWITAVQRESAWRRYFAPKDAERIAVGKWIRANTPKDCKIAVYAAGQVPYYSHRYAHDMLGLNDTHIADLRRSGMGHGTAGHEKFDVEYTLGVVHPELIVDGRSIPDMRRNPIYQTAYVPAPGWQMTDVRIRKDLLNP